MSDDPGILCFQHCQKNKKVFSFVLPGVCNFCKEDLANSELRVPPFRIPYPFCNAKRMPNTIVIKPSNGDFLNNYVNSSSLHIGVTDSLGNVFEYDSHGLNKSNGENWEQCLCIEILQRDHLRSYWDKVLNEVFQQECWTPDRYNAEDHNCYSFVLTFLKSLQIHELYPYIVDKTTFCQHFVAPQARVAAKYISLFRQLKM
ncbi:hypothetical protein X975_18852, partial [Stegodyphus mimosarum]